MSETSAATAANLPYYTYRIAITQSDRVHVQKRDPQARLLGEPTGVLNFTGEFKARVQAWQERASMGRLSAQEQKALSMALGEVLFDHRLQDDFYAFYEQVRDKEEYMRLELDIDEQALPELAALPWESMCLATNEQREQLYPGAVPRIALVRHRALWYTAPSFALTRKEPLRIALAVAAPRNAGPVLYQSIQESLEAIARDHPDRFLLLDIAHAATIEHIDNLLAQKPHILHIIAHTRFHDERGNEGGQLGLVDDILPDEIQWIDAEGLSTLFHRHRPRLVFLQACESGTLSSLRAFTGIASHIVQHNIGAVVAMQYEISNASAQRFAQRFYRGLVDDLPVELAVQQGRYRLAQVAGGYARRDFATLVLFLRAAHSRFFQAEAEQRHEVDTERNQPAKVVQPGTTVVQAKDKGIAVGTLHGNITQNNNG